MSLRLLCCNKNILLFRNANCRILPINTFTAYKFQANLLAVRKLHFCNILLEKEQIKLGATPIITKEDEAEKLVVKRSILKRITDELIHYYHGFKLLFINFYVAGKIVWRVLNGSELSRREHKQLVRTTSDFFRILPFSVFIVIPFMELLLPLALKLFPNMLPSTFQTTSKREENFQKSLKIKVELTKFLQVALDEIHTFSAKGEHHSEAAKEFAMFFEKNKTSGEEVTNENIYKFSKLFEDEITLDSLSRNQLMALCRLLELQTYGPNNFLRFQLRMKLRSLKSDDHLIDKEGIDKLSIPELQSANRARGMRALGISEPKLKSQLKSWLELSLDEKIPPSLLLLSRALYLPEHLATTEQLKATISSLPDTVMAEAKYKIGAQEGRVDNKTKLEIIKKEELEIKKENEEAKLNKLQSDAPTEGKIGYQKEEVILKKDEMPLEGKDLEKYQLLSVKVDIEGIKEGMGDYETKKLNERPIEGNLKKTKGADRLYKRVNKMVEKLDKMVKQQESKTGKDQKEEISSLIDIFRTIETLPDDEHYQKIAKLLESIEKDKHNPTLNAVHMNSLIHLLDKEKHLKMSPEKIKIVIEYLQKDLESQKKMSP